MKAYISELCFNTGETLALNRDDIVVFVGANNVGKSRALEDLINLCQKTEMSDFDSAAKTIIINDIKIIVEDKESMVEEALEQGWALQQNEGVRVKDTYYTVEDFKSEINTKSFGGLYENYVFYSSAGDQGDLYASSNYDSDETRYDPIHFLSDFKELRQKASNGFQRAFGKDLLPNRVHGGLIPLCIGNELELDERTEGKKGNEAIDAYMDFMKDLPEIGDQSDGIRRFTSILINLVLNHKKIFVLDEPETFLHPPQAQIMGQVISEYIGGRQAFIATHSQDIIKGLLEADYRRLKIIRILRENNFNTFEILDNSELWKDPLLKYTDILNGLFYKDVVICESDSDCKLYSTILSDIKRKKDEYLQVQFIPSNGKHRIPKIVKACKKMGTHVIAVVDIDLLSNKQDVHAIVDAYGYEDSRIYDYLNILSSQMNGNLTVVDRRKAKDQINEILNKTSERILSDKEIKEILKIITPTTRWKELKKAGKGVIPPGEATVAFNEVYKILRGLGVYIVECGELENFVKEVGGHGPNWVSDVLEQYPNLDNAVYEGLREFIKSWDV